MYAHGSDDFFVNQAQHAVKVVAGCVQVSDPTNLFECRVDGLGCRVTRPDMDVTNVGEIGLYDGQKVAVNVVTTLVVVGVLIADQAVTDFNATFQAVELAQTVV